MLDTLAAYADSINDGGSTMITYIYGIASIVGLWKMFEKAEEPGWYALVPFFNIYKLCEITMARPNYAFKIFWLFLPVVGWGLWLYYNYQICVATAAAYGKPKDWAWGYFFLAPIFFCVTGFDSNISYYGPYGQDDYRTESARNSTTVPYEVYVNQQYQANQEYEDVPEETIAPERTEILINGEPYKPKDSEVVFTFDKEEE